MSRWAPVVVGVIAALGVALGTAVAVGEEPYRLRLVLDNASGLRGGSEVRIGDVTAGKVASVALGPRDQVVAELELEPAHAPVGRDASVAISSLNLLGQKYVALAKGDPARPAPSGFTVPRSRLSTSTDLDQVLNVLDTDTRTRLAILINEAGFAVSGRRADFNQLLRELPRTTAAATELLDQFVGDNRTLAHLVDRSDAFIAQIARERRGLGTMVDTLGQTAATFAARRTQLRQTLERAPDTLRSLQGFLGDLRATTLPLGPAARDVAATAPALTSMLTELEPFRRAAEPALGEARRLAPALNTLARGATPVVRRATPTLRSMADFSRALVPVTDTLDHSMDNLLAIVHNWSRAIQFRDGLSHVFNAQLAVSPETLLSAIRRLERLQRGSRRAGAPRPGRRSPDRRPERPQAPAPGLSVPEVKVPRLPDLPRVPDPSPALPDDELDGVLDYLLGP